MASVDAGLIPLVVLNVLLAAVCLGVLALLVGAAVQDVRARRHRARAVVPDCWPPAGVPEDPALWPPAATHRRTPVAHGGGV